MPTFLAPSRPPLTAQGGKPAFVQASRLSWTFCNAAWAALWSSLNTNINRGACSGPSSGAGSLPTTSWGGAWGSPKGGTYNEDSLAPPSSRIRPRETAPCSSRGSTSSTTDCVAPNTPGAAPPSNTVEAGKTLRRASLRSARRPAQPPEAKSTAMCGGAGGLISLINCLTVVLISGICSCLGRGSSSLPMRSRARRSKKPPMRRAALSNLAGSATGAAPLFKAVRK